LKGIAVDVHVHRMSNLMAWSYSENRDTVQKQLESWIPKQKWSMINNSLASLAQILLQQTYRDVIVDYAKKYDRATDTILMLSWVYNTKNKILKMDNKE
jgi:endonuclease III